MFDCPVVLDCLDCFGRSFPKAIKASNLSFSFDPPVDNLNTDKEKRENVERLQCLVCFGKAPHSRKTRKSKNLHLLSPRLTQRRVKKMSRLGGFVGGFMSLSFSLCLCFVLIVFRSHAFHCDHRLVFVGFLGFPLCSLVCLGLHQITVVCPSHVLPYFLFVFKCFQSVLFFCILLHRDTLRNNH